MKKFKLSSITKLVTATFVSCYVLPIYAEPTTAVETGPNGYKKTTITDPDSVEVFVEGQQGPYHKSLYLGSANNLVLHNSAHLDSPDYKAFSNGKPIQSIEIENSGKLISSGSRPTSSIDYQWTTVRDKFSVKNTGEISTTGSGFNENAIIVNGSENTVYDIKNLGADSLISANTVAVRLKNGKSATLLNEGTIATRAAPGQKRNYAAVVLEGLQETSLTNTGTIDGADYIAVYGR
ncbi:hypothetical protein X781_21790 [Mannheimia sp. USDA-ARS-USMARC-1261]|uniref:hypothetical protein n=1 Tax=Mannheimia sp. USDA-ARS-USMARC-1261 TaxID=1432056 RepID=UPI0003E3C05F|nr:hypothetical protein [Mannheimia sp. USDA-ARS-USMARC-1261]AHG74324.1 hypothetical protein X781_21790 [Mannheimia sp. USDA-ARS-USMARC-1261]